jgi:hypothetical protein
MNFNNTVGILTQIWNFRVSVIVIEFINNSIISRDKSARSTIDIQQAIRRMKVVQMIYKIIIAHVELNRLFNY